MAASRKEGRFSGEWWRGSAVSCDRLWVVKNGSGGWYTPRATEYALGQALHCDIYGELSITPLATCGY